MGQYRHAVFSLTSTAMVVIAASARLVCLHRAGPPPWAWSCSSAGSDRRAEIRPPRSASVENESFVPSLRRTVDEVVLHG